jgi:hypothetical protein
VTSGHALTDDAELEAFLAGESPVSADYGRLEPVEPPAALDATIVAAARAAATSVARTAPASSATAAARPSPVKAAPQRPPPRVADDEDDDDDGDTVAMPALRRPRWAVPAAVAAGVLVLLGIVVAVRDPAPTFIEGKNRLSAMFAERARERAEAEKAAAEAAARELEVAVIEGPPLPPPPAEFEADSAQVADLEASMAVIRSELTRADTASGETAADGTDSAIQSRDRRLAKILELYDGGDPVVASEALEIFLRDFADDPLSRRILGHP